MGLSTSGKMKIELCAFSGFKIYPGHGKRMIKVDGRAFHFLNGKCAKSHLMKRNPRKINWTVLYRRKHKKGQAEETTKKRTRRTMKFARAIAGATLNDIMAKRSQKQERHRESKLLRLPKKNKRPRMPSREHSVLQSRNRQLNPRHPGQWLLKPHALVVNDKLL